jgi:hypothetical protein
MRDQLKIAVPAALIGPAWLVWRPIGPWDAPLSVPVDRMRLRACRPPPPRPLWASHVPPDCRDGMSLRHRVTHAMFW